VKKLFLLLTVFLMLALFSACGPIKSTMVINDTQSLLDSAKQMRAEEKPAAQYYYYAAHEYLRKAKDEEGHSDFQSAEHFGKKALDLARKAVNKARMQSSDQASTIEEQEAVK